MRVLFIDDHHLVRDALAWYLRKSAPDTEIVGVGSVEAAAAHASDNRFDLVLLDYKMPGVTGANAIRAVQSGFPDVPIVVLSGAMTRAEANHALEIGVAGVISKDIDGDRLWDVVREHLNGVSSMSETIGRRAPAGGRAELDALSRREAEVASLLLAGHPNKEIARKLGVAEITVRFHLRQVYRKLGARSRTDAVRMMMQRE